MVKIWNWMMWVLASICIFVMANSYVLAENQGVKFWMIAAWVISAGLILVPGLFYKRMEKRRLSLCRNGCEQLKIFLLSTVATGIYILAGFFGKLSVLSLSEAPKMWVIHTIIAILVEAALFWSGIIRIYISSHQLGLKWRLIGIVCGWIPIVHILVLSKMIGIASREAAFENQRILRNKEREDDKVCKTKYPILLVHGVFFRDFRYLNYWGRIPEELEKNGATIYYGNHQSAAPVAESAKELDARIRQIVADTGCEKVNVIAHSKGGLDTRYALSMLGTDSYVASLTTINTPHRGCEFADYLLSKIPKAQQDAVAKTYNAAFQKLGDENPDFLAAVNDLTASACQSRNEIVKDVPGLYYQSIGSKLNKAFSGRFPLNFTYQLVKYFDGGNDGLVGEQSFPWGENYRFLKVEGTRGISHGDMIDLNRENIDGFDVREFYVQLVQELKSRDF